MESATAVRPTPPAVVSPVTPAHTAILDTTGKPLVAGKWYALGIADLDDHIEWGGAPIYEYVGDGEWHDDDGEIVQSLWDAELQLPVSLAAADAYMAQS